jgi:hypothetical protein
MILELRNVKSQAAAFQPVHSARSRKEADGRVRLIFHQWQRIFPGYGVQRNVSFDL